MNGIFFFSKLKIMFGQISESTNKAKEGFQYSRNFLLKKLVSIGKN